MRPWNNRESQRGVGRHPEAPRTADSSSSSSSSESSTDTETGLVGVCTILCDNSEVSKRDRVTGKPVAVAEGREGGPVTLDLTKWDFNKADCRTRCRNLIENSKPLLLMGSPIDSGGKDEEQTRAVLQLAFICELYEIQVREGRYFLHTHSHSAKSWGQPTVVDFMNRFSDMFQTVIGRGLFGVNTPTGWLTNSGCIVQALSKSN